MKHPHIAFYNCKVNNIYNLHSRNLGFGVFTSSGTFIGLRTKFEDVFLDQELHWDRGGTARPLEYLGTVPDEIPLALSLGTKDIITGRMVEFDKPIADGGKGWYFVDDGVPSREIRPVGISNSKLFDYLKSLELTVEMIEQYSSLTNFKNNNLGFVPGTLNPVRLIDLPDNPTIVIDEESSKARKAAIIEWMTRGNMDHGNK
jgi:hypothetical protein